MDDFENKDRGFDGAEQEDGTTRIDMPRRHRREEALLSSLYLGVL